MIYRPLTHEATHIAARAKEYADFLTQYESEQIALAVIEKKSCIWHEVERRIGQINENGEPTNCQCFKCRPAIRYS